MTARERRPQCLGDRIQRGPDAVEQILQAVREQRLTHEHRQEKDWDPAVGLSSVTDNGNDERESDDEPRGAELREEVQPALGLRPHMIGAPLSDAGIEFENP